MVCPARRNPHVCLKRTVTHAVKRLSAPGADPPLRTRTRRKPQTHALRTRHRRSRHIRNSQFYNPTESSPSRTRIPIAEGRGRHQCVRRNAITCPIPACSGEQRSRSATAIIQSSNTCHFAEAEESALPPLPRTSSVSPHHASRLEKPLRIDDLSDDEDTMFSASSALLRASA
jgi:hypothetical protein